MNIVNPHTVRNPLCTWRAGGKVRAQGALKHVQVDLRTGVHYIRFQLALFQSHDLDKELEKHFSNIFISTGAYTFGILSDHSCVLLEMVCGFSWGRHPT